MMCTYFTAGVGVAKLPTEGEGEGSDKVNAKTRFWMSQSEVRRNGIIDSDADRLICNAWTSHASPRVPWHLWSEHKDPEDHEIAKGITAWHGVFFSGVSLPYCIAGMAHLMMGMIL